MCCQLVSTAKELVSVGAATVAWLALGTPSVPSEWSCIASAKTGPCAVRRTDARTPQGQAADTAERNAIPFINRGYDRRCWTMKRQR